MNPVRVCVCAKFGTEIPENEMLHSSHIYYTFPIFLIYLVVLQISTNNAHNTIRIIRVCASVMTISLRPIKVNGTKNEQIKFHYGRS